MTVSMLTSWRRQALEHRVPAAGLLVALLVVAWLLLDSGLESFSGENRGHVGYAVLGGLAGFGATALGALGALVLRRVETRAQDCMLGFAAGMMLAAASFSLILPGLDAARALLGSGMGAAFTVAVGLGLGVLLMLGLDYFTPHAHESAGPQGPAVDRIGRVWLFVLAIILHNLPEGMAIGVGFAQGDLSVGLPLTMAIAIQDIPEGLAVALALRAVGLGMKPAVGVAVASGLMEPLGALVGVGMASGLPIAYPVSLGIAAGAMIFVVSHEVIPETHRNGHQTAATVGLMAGFAVMMFLDTALG
ncbi:ZIP family metal transporter [uncultured Castellaniella sp.]|uniref:ZIP family metal transporter n=1 Tax=uncultured Castellaniella sp. TaxID=647907 RepID=UPI0026304B4E|nr:ZIP family metal transporter [uncultured Castellaniella sp.]